MGTTFREAEGTARKGATGIPVPRFPRRGEPPSPDEATKVRLLELLSAVATEATAPREARKTAVLRALLRDLGAGIGAVSGLA